MRLNPKKCKAIFNPGKNNLSPPTLFLDGGEIEIVSSYKYIGIEINKSLDWNLQWESFQIKSVVSLTLSSN